MTLSKFEREELYELLGLLLDEQLNDRGQDRLAELLVSDEAQSLYVREVNLHACLAWDWRALAGGGGEFESGAKRKSTTVDAADHGSFRFVETAGQTQATETVGRAREKNAGTSEVVQVLDTTAASRRPTGVGPFVVVDLAASGQWSLSLFAPGGVLFSYLVSVFLVVFGLFVGSLGQEVPTPHSPAEQNQVYVGRITGMIGCRWSNEANGAQDDSFVPLGQTYSLAAGLMEITYKTGPSVMLQGPATYAADSHYGGFLAAGRLTATVDNEHQPAAEKIAHAARQTTSLTPLFAVRTPTATVADLGTEFGVTVDPSGAGETHVFRGRVELRLTDPASQATKVIPLGENESARIARSPDSADVTRHSSAAVGFARAMPRRVPIAIKSTGIGLKEGEIDPHWKVVSRSDDANFQPRPVMVVAVDPAYRLPNDPGLSQWLSVSKELMLPPDEVTHTFRTTFDLTGMLPNTAVLRGRVLVDGHITAIRLNGRPIPLPASFGTISVCNYRVFEATAGFLEGSNVLEIDVLNGKYRGSSPTTASFIALRVELRGSAIPNWHQAPVVERRLPAAGEEEVPASR